MSEPTFTSREKDILYTALESLDRGGFDEDEIEVIAAKLVDAEPVRGALWESDLKCALQSGITRAAGERYADELALIRGPKLTAERAAEEYATALAKELGLRGDIPARTPAAPWRRGPTPGRCVDCGMVGHRAGPYCPKHDLLPPEPVIPQDDLPTQKMRYEMENLLGAIRTVKDERDEARRELDDAHEYWRRDRAERDPLVIPSEPDTTRGRSMEQIIEDAKRLEANFGREKAVYVCERCGHAQEHLLPERPTPPDVGHITLEQHGRVIEAMADEEQRRKAAEAEIEQLREALERLCLAVSDPAVTYSEGTNQDELDAAYAQARKALSPSGPTQ